MTTCFFYWPFIIEFDNGRKLIYLEQDCFSVYPYPSLSLLSSLWTIDDQTKQIAPYMFPTFILGVNPTTGKITCEKENVCTWKWVHSTKNMFYLKCTHCQFFLKSNLPFQPLVACLDEKEATFCYQPESCSQTQNSLSTDKIWIQVPIEFGHCVEKLPLSFLWSNMFDSFWQKTASKIFLCSIHNHQTSRFKIDQIQWKNKKYILSVQIPNEKQQFEKIETELIFHDHDLYTFHCSHLYGLFYIQIQSAHPESLVHLYETVYQQLIQHCNEPSYSNFEICQMVQRKTEKNRLLQLKYDHLGISLPLLFTPSATIKTKEVSATVHSNSYANSYWTFDDSIFQKIYTFDGTHCLEQDLTLEPVDVSSSFLSSCWIWDEPTKTIFLLETPDKILTYQSTTQEFAWTNLALINSTTQQSQWIVTSKSYIQSVTTHHCIHTDVHHKKLYLSFSFTEYPLIWILPQRVSPQPLLENTKCYGQLLDTICLRYLTTTNELQNDLQEKPSWFFIFYTGADTRCKIENDQHETLYWNIKTKDFEWSSQYFTWIKFEYDSSKKTFSFPEWFPGLSFYLILAHSSEMEKPSLFQQAKLYWKEWIEFCSQKYEYLYGLLILFAVCTLCFLFIFLWSRRILSTQQQKERIKNT